MKKARYTYSLFILLSLFFIQCENNSMPTLCDCVVAGKAVDEIAASLFDRTPTQASKDSLDEALKNRDKICFPFQTMLANELQEKAKDCEYLNFEAIE